MVQVSIFTFRLSSICGGSFSKGKSQGQDKKTPVPLWQSLIFFKCEVAPPAIRRTRKQEPAMEPEALGKQEKKGATCLYIPTILPASISPLYHLPLYPHISPANLPLYPPASLYPSIEYLLIRNTLTLASVWLVLAMNQSIL